MQFQPIFKGMGSDGFFNGSTNPLPSHPSPFLSVAMLNKEFINAAFCNSFCFASWPSGTLTGTPRTAWIPVQYLSLHGREPVRCWLLWIQPGITSTKHTCMEYRLRCETIGNYLSKITWDPYPYNISTQKPISMYCISMKWLLFTTCKDHNPLLTQHLLNLGKS